MSRAILELGLREPAIELRRTDDLWTAHWCDTGECSEPLPLISAALADLRGLAYPSARSTVRASAS